MSNFNKVMESLRSTGGFSYCLITGELNPNEGFMVGGNVSPAVYSGEPSEEEVKAFALEHSDLLSDEVEPLFLGGWRDDKTNLYHLDIVTLLPSEADARFLASMRRELAIFDNKRKVSIYL